MPVNNAAAKTFQELEKLDICTAGDYFQKFSGFLRETRATYSWDFNDIENGIEGRRYKIVEIADAINCLVSLLKNQTDNKKIMIIGNGGSAAIAMHALEDYANIGGLKIADFYGPALLTCMANDYGYENVFAKPVELFAEAGDMLFAISSSGKSPNILKACEAALAKKCYAVTFSGFSQDNPLRKLGYLNFYVPSTHYGFVELAHQTIMHCILDLFVKAKVNMGEVKCP